MNKTKRLTCIALILFLTGTVVFATGNRQSAVSTSTGTPTLQIAIDQQPTITDYADNYMTRYLENMHNVKLDFYMLPATTAEIRTRIALMAASNDMPETIWTTALTRELILEYGSQGFFLPLNRYFSDASRTPYFNLIPQADREKMLKDTVSPNGNNYAFPMFQPEPGSSVTARSYINRAWLSRLGLQEPRTTEELRNVLIAFRDRDPNGNGRRDEIGVFGRYSGTYGENVIVALINSFIYYNGTLALDSTGNTVIAPVTDPNFRRALQYLNGLFRDGLLEPSLFTVDQQGFRAVLNQNPPVVGYYSSGYNASDYPGGDVSNGYLNFKEFLPFIVPVRGPDGVSYVPFDETYAGSRTYITNKAKDTDLAVKVIDSFYSEDLSLIVRYGEENENWTRDQSIVGNWTNAYFVTGLASPTTTTKFGVLQNVWSTPAAKHWRNINPRYQPMEKAFGYVADYVSLGIDLNTDNASLAVAQTIQQLYPLRPQYLLPQLYYSEADGAALSQPITNINDYVRLSISEFVTSVRDVNSDAAWNVYLRELDNMGLQQWLRIAQATYNRQR